MAGDWIKMRIDLHEDPAVIGMASMVGEDEFAVVGRLHTLWGWADKQTRDGHATYVTPSWINTKVRCDGFAEAMMRVRWLEITAEGVVFPNFDRHNGETAKQRGLAANRQSKKRAGVTPQVTPMSRNERDAGGTNGVTREEKNREDSQVGESSTRTDTEEALAAQARAAVEHVKALRRLGMYDVHVARPELLELIGLGVTVEQACMTSAELTLRKAQLLNDPDMHPDLLALAASGATAAQMCLTPEQYQHLKSSVPNLPYLAKTLIGRAHDARQGDTHATGTTAGRGASRQGSQGGRESLAGRSERLRREGDARDDGDPFGDSL